ncbi:MAG: capsular polysaccharide synthesis protein [Treponema sp.]|jgi:hypothetical protein|nr:capsular polysaccharide synthesis protein [Treponema sp.]
MKIKSFFQSNISRIPRFFKQWRLYGFSIAFCILFFPFNRFFGPLKPHIAGLKHRAILKYLSKRYINILNEFAGKATDTVSNIEPSSPLWVCWWDGEEAMPEIVKACYNSIKKYALTHPVKLITKHNFNEFISLPEHILQKVNSKIMTVTHFSNILRANLLFDYGGIWMDSTILTLKNITLDDLPFYTLKAPAKKSVSVTLNRFAGLCNKSARLNLKTINPQISRWSGFLFAGTKGNIIFDYMRQILYAYWKDHDDQIDYLLYDYTIALGYDNIPFMKKLIDNVPCSDAEKFDLEKNMNTEFSEENFAKYFSTQFHKLAWKIKFNTHTKDGKLTIYGHILEGNNI